MRRVFADAEVDEDGRKVIRLGDACPICGNGPDVKYSGDGNVVMYHLPVACNGHMRNWKARFQVEKEREVRQYDDVDEPAPRFVDRRYGT